MGAAATMDGLLAYPTQGDPGQQPFAAMGGLLAPRVAQHPHRRAPRRLIHRGKPFRLSRNAEFRILSNRRAVLASPMPTQPGVPRIGQHVFDGMTRPTACPDW